RTHNASACWCWWERGTRFLSRCIRVLCRPWVPFTKSLAALTIDCLPHGSSPECRSGAASWLLISASTTENAMAASTTGELIRLMNYVDDITTTLRRITANLTLMSLDERKRLAEYLRKADGQIQEAIKRMESG